MSYEAVSLASDVFWIGALNPKLRVFDVIMRTEQGTTYNAYVVRGREKTAVIETVKRGFTEEFFARLQKVVPLERVDYIVCNHLEPDHSGSLAAVHERMPQARIVVSKNGQGFLPGLTHVDLNPLAVESGDKLDLGGKTLEFITAPFLHWPDTMFTYLPEEQILFSCDFLGSHFCSEQRFSDQVGEFFPAFKYYFDVIMRPFKEYVLKGLAAIEGRPLRMVAPSHGPILNQNLPRYLEQYRQWAREPAHVPGGSLLVFYVSAYGFTASLAKAMAEGAQAAGVKTRLFNLEETSLPDVLHEIEAADGLAVGSCTINGDAVKPAWDLLSSLATLKLKGKLAAAFGSYGWSGEAVPMLEERLRALKFKLAAPGLKVKFNPRAGDVQAARDLGSTLAEKIKETNAARSMSRV